MLIPKILLKIPFVPRLLSQIMRFLTIATDKKAEQQALKNSNALAEKAAKEKAEAEKAAE